MQSAKHIARTLVLITAFAIFCAPNLQAQDASQSLPQREPLQLAEKPGGVAGPAPCNPPCDICHTGTCDPNWKFDFDCDCNCGWSTSQDVGCFASPDSCAGRCGSTVSGGCQCDSICVVFGDCCPDACDVCGECEECGDFSCTASEDCTSCLEDCSYCDDGCCDPSRESCISCPQDCGDCCGDGFCDWFEDSCNCPADCQDDTNSCSYCECDPSLRETGQVAGQTCGCDPGCVDRNDCCGNACETCGSCADTCGDGVCGPTEGCQSCLTDCGQCGACCFTPPVPFVDCDDDVPAAHCTGLFTSFHPGESCAEVDCGPAYGACCNATAGFQTAGEGGSEGCSVMPDFVCAIGGGTFMGEGTECTPNICNRDQRVSTVKKGSLLIFPKVELRWDAAGVLTQDTIITLVNDFTKDVHVKLYFVNGDAPTEAIYADDLETILVERAHNGWNNVDCVIELTENESTYLVMSTGVGGCQRFSILDPGTPPGRPNLEADGGRVLRGFVIAFAVDENQNEISFNHLSGHADLIHYGLRSAWEYQSYAFQALNPVTGTWTDYYPGELSLDGLEYDYAFNTLLFDFFAVGSTVFSNGGITVMLDTDLTLHPVSADLRQDTCGPITTKAHFDIWNANEDFRSGTARCITCWDQTLLSAYSVGNGLDNNFILADLGTDKGKARIDGVASFECDNLFVPPDLDDAILQWLLLHDRTCDPSMTSESRGDGSAAGIPGNHIDCCFYTINDSQNAALLGVAAKILSFSGGASGTTWAGMNLVGAGQQSAEILFDVPAPPETATDLESSSQRKNTSLRSTLGEGRGK